MVIKKNKKIKNESKPEKKQMNKDDIDFLNKILKIKDEASKKVFQELTSSFPDETEKYKTKGKEIAKELEEIEKCNKIVKEFEANPIIRKTVHVNGILFEESYENNNVVKKIELLKKHNFRFLKATKDTSIDAINFKTLGKVYVKRGTQKIVLPETSRPPLINESTPGMGYGKAAISLKEYNPFILQDGDIIATDDNSYFMDISDSSTKNRKINIWMFPNSEIKINVKKNQIDTKPSFMDPSKVPEIIKERSSRTVITYLIRSIELMKGIFQISAEDYTGGDPHNLFKLSSNYPQIEFRSSTEIGVTVLTNTLKKIKAENHKELGIVESEYNKAIANAKNKKCDSIDTYIELCNNGSIVIFGTINSVGIKGTNKFAHPLATGENKYIVTDPMTMPGKVTITASNIYTTAGSDPRVNAIIKHKNSLTQYIAMSDLKKEYENRLKEAEKKPVKQHIETPAEKAYKEQEKKELLEQLEYYKKFGNKLEIEAIEMQLEELEPKNTGQGKTGIDVNYAEKMIKYAESEMERLKPYIKADFPEYSSIKKI